MHKKISFEMKRNYFNCYQTIFCDISSLFLNDFGFLCSDGYRMNFFLSVFFVFFSFQLHFLFYFAWLTIYSHRIFAHLFKFHINFYQYIIFSIWAQLVGCCNAYVFLLLYCVGVCISILLLNKNICTIILHGLFL